MRSWAPWTMAAAGLTLAALLASWGGSASLARLVAPSQEVAPVRVVEEVAEVVTPDATSARTKSQYIRAILARNIFDHTAIGQDAPPQQTDGEVHTDLDLVLLGTMVAVPEDYSSALIMRDQRGADSWGYGLGDRVLGAELVRIERNKVWLRRQDGRVEVLVQGGPPEEEAPSRRGRSGSSDDAIAEVGQDSFAIDRGYVDELLQNPTGLARLGRARPHRRNGEVDGYRLSRLRRNSLGRKLGLKNGDVVHSVNGHGLTSMGEAMQAWTTLQSDTDFQLKITRRGRNKTLSYEIR